MPSRNPTSRKSSIVPARSVAAGAISSRPISRLRRSKVRQSSGQRARARARNGKRRTFRGVDHHLAPIPPGPICGSGLHRGGADRDVGRAKRLDGAGKLRVNPVGNRWSQPHETRRTHTQARTRTREAVQRHHGGAPGGDPKARILRHQPAAALRIISAGVCRLRRTPERGASCCSSDRIPCSCGKPQEQFQCRNIAPP